MSSEPEDPAPRRDDAEGRNRAEMKAVKSGLTFFGSSKGICVCNPEG